MKEVHYYLIFMDKKRSGILWLRSSVTGEIRKSQIDITEFDAITYNLTKEEFMSQVKYQNRVDLEDKDFFIARVTEKGKINIYDCLFKPTKTSFFYISINEDLTFFIKERLSKIYQNNNTIKLSETLKLKRFINKLLLLILSNDKCRIALTSKNSIIKPIKLQETIKKCIYTYQINTQFPYFLSQLSNYKTLRGVLLEYLNYNQAFLLKNNLERIKRVNQMFMSDIYQEEATKPSKTPSFSLTDIECSKIAFILSNPYENEELGYYYKIGGLEKVFHYMDTNDIYNSSYEDLLRCGIISKEDYIKRIRKNS